MYQTLCIDAGNTFIKLAIVEQNQVVQSAHFLYGDTQDLFRWIRGLKPVDACVISSVVPINPILMNVLSRMVPFFLELKPDTPVPIQNLYLTPKTLGKDRLAAVVGASVLYPEQDVLVIDAGTALTFDFIDHTGCYHGGNISPGLKMRFRALHDYTKKLPMLEQNDDYQLIGNSTNSAIISGVQNGMIFEIEKYIEQVKKVYINLITIITGGDAIFFVNKIENPIFANSDLVFIGLDKIVQYNLNKKS